MKQYLMDIWIQTSLIRKKSIVVQVQKIEDKVEFDASKSDGVNMACCVVANFFISKSESEVTEQEILESLSSEQELLRDVVLVKTFKTSGHLGHSFVLIFKTKEAAIEFADNKQVHKFKDSPLNIILLSNMVARKEFTSRVKDFEDDPANTDADDSRRIMVTTTVTSAKKNSASGKDRAIWLSETQAASERLGSYFKETRTGQLPELFWKNSHSFCQAL